MFNKSKVFFLGVFFVSATAFAGDATGIAWGCSETNGNLVKSITIVNGEASISTYDKTNEAAPVLIGGPYKQLVTFGGGDFIGVKSQSGKFSLIAGSVTATLNDGTHLSLDNVVCKNLVP